MSLRPSDPVPGAPRACQQAMDLGAELPYFAGHFPGAPVLPGAAQLAALVLPAVARVRPDWGPLRSATRLKFRRPLGPGDRVVVHLSFGAPAGQVSFRIERRGEVCASGVLELQVSDPRGG